MIKYAVKVRARKVRGNCAGEDSEPITRIIMCTVCAKRNIGAQIPAVNYFVRPGLFGRSHFLDFDDYRLIRRPVCGVFPDVHISYAAFFIEDKDRRMRYTAVFSRVHDPVLGNGFLFRIGKNLEFRAGGLCHRPGVGLLINADGEKLRACLFYLVVVLSQPGELLCARASPEAPVEDKHDWRSRSVLGQNHELAIAVGEREVRRLRAYL